MAMAVIASHIACFRFGMFKPNLERSPNIGLFMGKVQR